MNSHLCRRRTFGSTLILLLATGIPLAAQSPRDILPLPPSGDVTLPLDEYNRLVALASKPGKRPENLPLNFAIQRATLAFKASDECVLGSVQLEGETYTKNAIKVPLTSNMTILDARQDGKILPLEVENGMHTAVLPGAANFDVSLDAGVPLAVGPGRASIHIPVPSASSARLTLTVPGDHTNVHLSPGIITSRNSSNGQTSIEATLVPGQVVNVSWATREIVAPVAPKEVRFLSDLKSLISVSESDLRLTVLANISVVQGDPTQFNIALPSGYELTSATGPTLDSSETQNGVVTLHLTNSAARSHEFLLSLEKSISESKAEPPFLSFADSQRETGEVLVEGAGTMELTAKEAGSLKRMDVKEVSPYLRSLARFPLQAAFRYHRQPSEPPALSLEWTRFPDSSVLAAVAERAVVTTLVTSQGRSLTEIKLTVKNQAQPFLKVDLPTGANIVSAEVAGEKVKPVQGADGARVPLLRERFRPNGPYFVSFVFLHSGAPFAKKGGSDIALPKMDIPINLLQWEVFLPQQYKVKDFGGDALATSLLPPTTVQAMDLERDEVVEYAPPTTPVNGRYFSLAPGQIGGIVVDPSGAVVSGAQVAVINTSTGMSQRATTDSNGYWTVGNLGSGNLRVTVSMPGFKAYSAEVNYDAARPFPLSSTLQIGAAMQSITVEAETTSNLQEFSRAEKKAKQIAQEQQTAASANVANLQRRVAGVLPVAIDVPRAGNSYRFVRPLVLDQETKLTFTYKTK